MGKIKDLVIANKTRMVAILIALVVAIVCCVMGENYLSKNNGVQRSAEITENYTLEQSTKLGTDTTVQTGTVTVHYVDQEGHSIIENTVKTGNVGDFYEVERPTISMYVRDGDEPITKAGRYENGNIDVTFKYKPSIGEVLKKVEKEGEEDATNNVVNIAFNNTKKVREYGLKIITKDDNGNVINGGEFNVRNNNTLIRSGKVINGDFYVGRVALTKEGKLTYNIEQTKATVGYKKIENIVNLGVNSTWNTNTKQFEITLDNNLPTGVTARIQENSNSVDEIIVEIINKKYANMYEVELVNKCGAEIIEGGKFKVDRNQQTEKEDYTTDGKLYIGEYRIDENGTDRYLVYELETAEGYYPVLKDGQAGVVEVQKTFNSETNTYDIAVQHSNIEGFSAEADGNGKVTIYVINEKKADDYDLAVKKFVSKIDNVETSNREPKVEIVEEKDETTGEMVKKYNYTQNNEIEKAANEQKVTYTIRTYNESNAKGVGQRVIEYIPDGLIFLPENEVNKEYQWKTYKQDKDGDLVETDVKTEITAVATDYLTDKEIEGSDIEKNEMPKYKDVQVVFEIDEDKITSKDRIIENTVKIDDVPNGDTSSGREINDKNNVTTEKIYVKYFDLSIVKFIKEVTVKNNIKETKQEVGESQKGKLLKIDVAKAEVENTTIRVTYGLRVKNVGEIEGYATELMDYIPKDFVLVEDGIWKVSDDKAVTTKLQNTLLKPGESTVIEITFDWKLTEQNIGRRINEGFISKYDNPHHAKDLTDDNHDKEEMLVQLRTGNAWVFIAIAALVGLWTVVGIIFLVRKMK